MLRTTHELKTPFAAIHANAQLLLRGHCGVLSDEALDVVRRIARRCSRLASEIQEMLQLANLRSSSDRPLQPTELDLAEVVGWAIGQVSQTAEQRGVAIGAELETTPIMGVQDHLRMLLANLLSNAVAYSQEGGRVEVRCRAAASGDGVLVSIGDNGIGIAPEKLPRIFDEYYRTNEAARHNKESTGLGLAIVQHVALEHGIRVRVESTLKEGTVFTLGFPRGEEPAGISREGGYRWRT
jgi:signal transduction histidine kinase